MRTWIATALAVSLATSAVAHAAAWSGECLPTIEPQLESLSALVEEIAPGSSCASADGVPFAIEPRVSVTEIRLPSYVGPRDIGQPSGEQKIVIASWLPFVTAGEEIAPRPVFVINQIEPYRRAKQIHTQVTSLVHESVSVPIGRGIGSLTFVGPKWQSWRAKSFTGLLDMGVEGIHSTALIAATGGIGIAYQNLKAAEDYWGTPLDVGHGTSELVDGVRTGDFDRAVDGYTEACSGVMLALSAAVPLARGAEWVGYRPSSPALRPASISRTSPPTSPQPPPAIAPVASAPQTVLHNITVVDKFTGRSLTGSIDLQPTLDRIRNGGSYPHKNDGMPFLNRIPKGKTTPPLAAKPANYYREYVHPTPWIAGGPGPQRVVVGAGGEIYYTPDHYVTFIPIR